MSFDPLLFKMPENYDAAKTMMANPWWEPEYDELFTPDFTIDMPFAPPGMDQHLGVGQVLPHKEWLNRTVKNWYVNDMKVYGPRDPFGDKYIIVRRCGGDVHWGGRDGRFESRMTTLLSIRNGKILYMKEWFNPLEFLKAAGLGVPAFRQTLDRENAPHTEKVTLEDMGLELTKEAAAKRAEDNVLSFITLDSKAAGQKRIQSPDFKHAVWNAPPDMLEEYPEEDLEAFDKWVWDSITGFWAGHPDMIPYATDDPHYYFLEAGGYGQVEWIGNYAKGGYGNRYIKYIEIDDNGLLARWDENLNPISKFNSINVSLPTFPYLY